MDHVGIYEAIEAQIAAQDDPALFCRERVADLAHDPQRSWECLCHMTHLIRLLPQDDEEAKELLKAARFLIQKFRHDQSPALAKIVAFMELHSWDRVSGFASALHEDLAAVKSDSPTDDLDLARRLRSSGRAIEAARIFVKDPGSILEALQALRVGGDFAAFDRLSSSVQAADFNATDGQILKWERVSLEVQRRGGLELFSDLVRRGSNLRQFPYVTRVMLWCMALDHPQVLAVAPNSRGLKALAVQGHVEDEADRAIQKVLLALEQAWSGEGSVGSLLSNLEKTLEKFSAAVKDGELVMLVWAAVARWSRVFGLGSTCVFAESQCKMAGFLASDGSNPDPLGLLTNQRAWEALGQDAFSPRARLVGLTALAFGMGKDAIKSRVSSLTANQSDKQRLREKEIEAHAERLTRHVSHFKGTLLKLGQVAHHLEKTLPKPFVDALAKVQDRTTRLPAEVVVGILEREWQRPLKDVFANFDEWPVAAASVGQVHRAELRDGRIVAVKIQYPEVERAFNADIASLNALIPIFKIMAPGSNPADLIRGVKDMMTSECDYTREAAYQQRFRAAIAGLEGVAVPEIISELCTKRVLVSEFVEGQHLQDFRRLAGQDQCDLAAERIFRGSMTAQVVGGLFNADPHPGNFRFTGDKVYFLDFGGCHEDDGHMLRIRDAVLREDWIGLAQTFQEWGMFRKGKALNAIEMKDHFRVFGIFFREEFFRFNRDFMDEMFACLKEYAARMTIPRAILPGTRFELALVNVLVGLEAGANWGQILTEVVTEAEARSASAKRARAS